MAQTIMLDTAGRFKSIIIDRGSADGVQVNDVIANANGLVGRVVLTTNDLAKVQLVTDNNCSVGALVERTRRQGVVRGNGGTVVQMFDIPALADVQPGDRILTAGIDGVYPQRHPHRHGRPRRAGTVALQDRRPSSPRSTSGRSRK